METYIHGTFKHKNRKGEEKRIINKRKRTKKNVDCIENKTGRIGDIHTKTLNTKKEKVTRKQ